MTRLCLLGLSIFCISCASTKRMLGQLEPPQHQLEITHDVQIQSTDGKLENKKAGDTFMISDQPALIEAPGHLSLLVVPLEKSPHSAKIKLRPLDQWMDPISTKHYNEKINEIVNRISEVQMKLASGKAEAAHQQVVDVMQKYPKVSVLKFLQVSCLLVLNKKPEARTALESALLEYPDHRAGRDLYRALTGNEYKTRVPAASKSEVKK